MHNTPNQMIHIINQIPGSIGLKSLDSSYIVGNRFFAKTVGLKHGQEFSGRTDHDIDNLSEFATTYRVQDQHIMNSETTLQLIQLRHCADHVYRLFYAIKKPLYNEHDKLIGVIGHGTNLKAKLIDSLLSYLHTNKHDKPKEQTIKIETNFTTSDKKIILTQRESEVIFHLLRGRTLKMIAKCLHISSRTVESHVNKVKGKFNCTSKSQLIERCLASGLFHIIPTHIAFKLLGPVDNCPFRLQI